MLLTFLLQMMMEFYKGLTNKTQVPITEESKEKALKKGCEDNS